MELGEAHLDEENLEALAWERQVLKIRNMIPLNLTFFLGVNSSPIMKCKEAPRNVLLGKTPFALHNRTTKPPK
jgi:hypothetical protein